LVDTTQLLEVLGLDDTIELKYGADIYITIRNTLTDELIWEYPQDFETNNDYVTLFQRTLTMYQSEEISEDLFQPVEFTLQIHQSNI